MRYSVIKSRNKQILRNDSKLWLFFTTLIFFSFIAIKIFIAGQIYIIDAEIDKNKIARSDYEKETLIINDRITLIHKESKVVSELHARNRVIKDSLINIFELVPDQIYLTDLNITPTALDIRGYTPSKEVFNYLLKPPLESIFEKSETSFYPMGNGWLSFRSINESKEKLIYEKK